MNINDILSEIEYTKLEHIRRAEDISLFPPLKTSALLPPFSGQSSLLFQLLAAIFVTIGQKLYYSTTSEARKNYEKGIDSSYESLIIILNGLDSGLRFSGSRSQME